MLNPTKIRINRSIPKSPQLTNNRTKTESDLANVYNVRSTKGKVSQNLLYIYTVFGRV